MHKKVEESAWSDNDELESQETNNKKKRCAFCYEYLEESQENHEVKCKIAKKCNASRVMCKSGIKKFVCDLCYSTFEFLKSLVEHEKRHNPPGGFFCNYCDARFCTDCEKQRHTENVHKVYKCQLCQNVFETSDSYVEHIKVDHNGKQDEMKPCQKCNRMFSSLTFLQKHIDSNCGKNKQFQCDVCQKLFTTKGILKTHMLSHNESKEFVCPYCGKAFYNKYRLKSHELSHTKEKIWKCNVCNAEFSWRQSLITHSTLHTGIKPYICECCGSRFSCTSNIIAHRKKRPDTCGLPQYCKQLTRAAPRPSIYNPEMLTMDPAIKVKKNLKVIKETDKEKFRTKKVKKRSDNTDMVNEKANTNSLTGIIGKSAKEIIEKNKHLSNGLEDENVNRLIHDDKRVGSISHADSNLEVVCVAKKFQLKFEEFTPQSNEMNIYLEYVDKQDKPNKMENTNVLNICDNLVISDNANLDVGDNNDSIVELKNDTTIEKYDFCDDRGNFDDGCDNRFSADKLQSNNESNTINFEENRNESQMRRRSTRLNRTKIEDGTIEEEKKTRGRRKVSDGNRLTPIRKKVDLIKCPFCESAVYRKYTLKQHLKRKHQKSDEEISFVLSSIEEKGPNFDCDICSKKFTGKLSFEKHYKLHGEDKNLTITCHDCFRQRFFRNREELRQHIQTEHRDLKCTECEKTFKLKSSLKEHILRIHQKKPNPPDPTITCVKCGKLVKKCLLRDHERSNCGQEYLYECKTCLKKFSTAGILKEHKKIHTGELHAFCKFCSKGFRNRYQCQQHEMIHTGVKPFKCTYEGCNSSFAHRNNMINHYSLHTGLRRYMCNGCTERFSCISSLKAHWRTHADTCALHPANTTKSQFKLGLKKGQVIQC